MASHSQYNSLPYFFYFLISEGEQGFHNCFFSETMVKFKCQRAVLCQQTMWGNQRAQESFSVDREVRFLCISETQLSFLTKESQPETGSLSQVCGSNQRLLLEHLRLGPHETNSTGQTHDEHSLRNKGRKICVGQNGSTPFYLFSWQ